MPIGYIAINIPDNVVRARLFLLTHAVHAKKIYVCVRVQVLERINVQFETWEQDTDVGIHKVRYNLDRKLNSYMPIG